MGARCVNVAKILSAVFLSSIILMVCLWQYFLSDFPYTYGLTEKENDARVESLCVAWKSGKSSETLQVPVLGHVFLVDVMNDERTVVEGFSPNVPRFRDMQIDTGDYFVQLWKKGEDGILYFNMRKDFALKCAKEHKTEENK